MRRSRGHWPTDANLLAISAIYDELALHKTSRMIREGFRADHAHGPPYSISTHPSLPVKTAADLISLARAKPGALNFASGGLGSAGHMTGELFKSMARIQMTYIPYKGGELALIDLIAGQVHVVFTNLRTSLPHLRTGRVRVFAVTGPRRHPAVPRIPTVTESGLPGDEPVSCTAGWPRRERPLRSSTGSITKSAA
jgi:tripartite-type tricarboxylate transporter receptor subunit TctC